MKSNVNVIIENERVKMLADECALIKGHQRASNPVYAGIIAGLCSDGGFEYQYILETADTLFARIIARDKLDLEILEEQNKKMVLEKKAREIAIQVSEIQAGLKAWVEVNDFNEDDVFEAIHILLEDETEGE